MKPESEPRPLEYELKRTPVSNIEFLAPITWFYSVEDGIDDCKATTSETSHGPGEYFTTGFIITVVTRDTKGVNPNEIKSDSRILMNYFKQKVMFKDKDLKFPGQISVEENPPFLIGKGESYPKEEFIEAEKDENTSNIVHLPDRIIFVKVIVNQKTGALYVARFVIPANEPDKKEIANTVMDSIKLDEKI